MKQTTTILVATAIGLLAAVTNARAALFSDRDAWEAAVASPTAVGETWESGLALLAAGSAVDLPSLTTITFDLDLFGMQVPTDWATWSGGNEPRVLFTGYGFDANGNLLVNLDPTTVGATFSAPVSFFGLEMQPNLLNYFSMTLDNGDVITQLVNGYSGAAFFGWAGDPVVSFTMTTDDLSGFAFGRMVEGYDGLVPVPEPSTIFAGLLVLLPFGVGASSSLRRRFRAASGSAS